MIHVRDCVRVVGITDGAGDSERIGERGTVVRRIVDDCGASPGDPLLLLRFEDRQEDVFWTEELRQDEPMPPRVVAEPMPVDERK